MVVMKPSVLEAQLFDQTPDAGGTHFAFGAGVSFAPVYMARSVNNDHTAKGLNLVMIMDPGNYTRLSFEYNHYGSINISPTWSHIRAQCAELNVQTIARSNDGRFFFGPVIGVSYNSSAGYYTGLYDNTNFGYLHSRNTNVGIRWFGVSMGCVADFKINRSYLSLTLLKLRVGKPEGYEHFNVMDVNAGISVRYDAGKLNVSMNKLFPKRKHPAEPNAAGPVKESGHAEMPRTAVNHKKETHVAKKGHRRIFGRTRSRYMLKTKKVSK